ncbi:MAG: DUF1697 domain-containing protein, partial [Candidatus Dormibacteria bacterium]
ARRMVALLRGINVGGNNMIPMARLRELMEGLGFDGIQTLLQSGNVVFTSTSSPDVAATLIEEQLISQLGLRVRVFVRDGTELATLVDGNPLADVAVDPARYLVTFLSAKPDPDLLAGIDAQSFAPEIFRVGRREIFVWSPYGIRELRLNYAFWEKRLGVTATARNWNTVTKLRALAAGRPQ